MERVLDLTVLPSLALLVCLAGSVVHARHVETGTVVAVKLLSRGPYFAATASNKVRCTGWAPPGRPAMHGHKQACQLLNTLRAGGARCGRHCRRGPRVSS